MIRNQKEFGVSQNSIHIPISMIPMNSIGKKSNNRQESIDIHLN